MSIGGQSRSKRRPDLYDYGPSLRVPNEAPRSRAVDGSKCIGEGSQLMVGRKPRLPKIAHHSAKTRSYPVSLSASSHALQEYRVPSNFGLIFDEAAECLRRLRLSSHSSVVYIFLASSADITTTSHDSTIADRGPPPNTDQYLSEH